MRISCLQSAYWYANNLVTLIMNSERFLNKASNYVLSFNNTCVPFQGPPESRVSHFLFCVSISPRCSRGAGVGCRLRSFTGLLLWLKICLLYTKGRNNILSLLLCWSLITCQIIVCQVSVRDCFWIVWISSSFPVFCCCLFSYFDSWNVVVAPSSQSLKPKGDLSVPRPQ